MPLQNDIKTYINAKHKDMSTKTRFIILIEGDAWLSRQ